MNYFRVLLLGLLVVSVFSSVTIRVGQTFSQSISQNELINYLNMLTGLNHQSFEVTPELRKIVFALRPSIINPIQKLTILLVIDNNIQSISEGKVELSNQIGSFVSTYNKKLAFAVIPNSEQKATQQEIEKYCGEKSVVVIIRDNQNKILKLSQLLQINAALSSKRRLNEKQEYLISPQQQATNDEFYLIKFFFSILFIIVIIGIVVSIASNEGKKDTLLYAKFIADVNNAR